MNDCNTNTTQIKNYKKLYESTDDKSIQKKYLEKMKIDNYMSTILNLEVFIKNKFST